MIALLGSRAAYAGGAAFPVMDINFDVTDISFSGTGNMPLGPNFSLVKTDVLFRLSGVSQGHTMATGNNIPIQNGDQLFFETTTVSLNLDIIFTDVDGNNDFAGNVTSFPAQHVVFNMGDVAFVPNCTADTSQPFAGCGMVLNANFNDGDVTTSQGGDYDLISSPSLPISLGQDADGMNGIDAISAMDLQIAFSAPLTNGLAGDGRRLQTYDVSALWSGSINPNFGPIALTGSATVVPEPGVGLLLLAGGLLTLRRFRRH